MSTHPVVVEVGEKGVLVEELRRKREKGISQLVRLRKVHLCKIMVLETHHRVESTHCDHKMVPR